MSKLHWLTALALAGTILISANLPAQPKDEFKITSFIPEKFKDFEWTVEGQGGVTGGSSKYTSNHSINESIEHDLSRYSQLDASIFGRTRPTFQWYTPKNNIRVDLPFDLSWVTKSYDSYDTSTYLSDYQRSEEHSDQSYLRTVLSPAINLQEYSFGDCFVNLDAYGQLSYFYQPSEDNIYQARNRYLDVGGFVIDHDEYRTMKSSGTRRENWVRGVVRVGVGRLYSGYHAATAMYFRNELRERGLLRQEPDVDQMLALTELVYKRRLLHAVDSRKFQIETWQQLLDYAQANGLIDSVNSTALVLQDVWRYFPYDSRKFGWQVSFGRGFDFGYSSGQSTTTSTLALLRKRYHPDTADIVDTISYSNTKETRSSHNKNTREVQYLTLLAEFSRPLSLTWQVDCIAEGRAYLNETKDPSPDGSRRKTSEKYYADLKALLRCFIDSRSRISLLGTANYQHQLESRIESNGTVSSYNSPSGLLWSLGGSFDLRVTMPTTLTMTANVVSDWDENDYTTSNSDSRKLNYSMSIGLIHHIY